MKTLFHIIRKTTPVVTAFLTVLFLFLAFNTSLINKNLFLLEDIDEENTELLEEKEIEKESKKIFSSLSNLESFQNLECSICFSNHIVSHYQLDCKQHYSPKLYLLFLRLKLDC